MSFIETAVLTSSDRCSKGEAEDVSGKLVSEMLKTIGGRTDAYDIVPDEIAKKARGLKAGHWINAAK